MHAEYDRESDDYNAHRVVQAFDTAQFIQSTRCDSCVQVLAGDLNTEPGDLAYRILLVASGLKESYNEDEHEDYGTNECGHNSYTPSSMKENNPRGKRIDYILYRAGVSHQVRPVLLVIVFFLTWITNIFDHFRFFKAKVLEYKQPIPRTVPDTKLSYSDHEAVTTKILIQPRKKATDAEDSCSAKSAKVNEKSYADTLGEGIEVLDQILKRLRSDKSAYFVSYSSKHRKNQQKY